MRTEAIGRFKLAIVISHPIQYYSPWFREIARHPALNSCVFYLNTHGVSKTVDPEFEKSFVWDTDLLSGYTHEFVPNTASRPGSQHFWGLRNPSLRRMIRKFNPDALLLFGYNYYSHLSLILRPPVPLIFRGDSTLLRLTPIKETKRLVLRFIYSRFSAFLPVGRANIDYFLHCGVASEKLFLTPHCVDISHFMPTQNRLTEASKLRARLGISIESTVLLFSGKFVPIKSPELLLTSFLCVAKDFANVHLILSGDGGLLPRLRGKVLEIAQAEPKLSDRIHFLPFANQSEIPVRYLLSDCLVMPSQSESWGLSVNEAMHLGRPAIVSDRVGCHPDLIEHGKTGWVFRSGDAESLAQMLREVLSLSREELYAKGRAAQAKAASFNYENATAGLLSALKSIPLTGH